MWWSQPHGNDNKTPLHYAVENGTQRKVEKILRQERSDLKPKDNNGKTALDIAKQSQSMPIIIAIAERNCESTLYITVATVVFLYVLSCLLNLAINSMFYISLAEKMKSFSLIFAGISIGYSQLIYVYLFNFYLIVMTL